MSFPALTGVISDLIVLFRNFSFCHSCLSPAVLIPKLSLQYKCVVLLVVWCGFFLSSAIFSLLLIDTLGTGHEP